MTLDEARLQLQGRIEGTIGAMKAAGSNGKPIFLTRIQALDSSKPAAVGLRHEQKA